MRRYVKFFMLFILLISISACKHWWKADDDDDDSPFQGMSAQQIYTEGQTKLKKKQYSDAINHFEALDTLYPFNDYAEQSQIDLIYAYFKKEDYPSTAATAERFIHLYPRSKRVDYAYYMKGLAHFHQVRGTLAQMLPMDLSWRDPGTQSQAYSDFATLVEKYPESRYKANAAQHMIYLRNLFAQKELNVALYYYQRKMYVAAEERASYLVKTYPEAASSKTALAIVYQSDLQLNLTQAANDALTVYRATYHADPKKIPAEKGTL